MRAARALALAALALAAATARADDLGGNGFGVPTAPPWREAREHLVVQLRPAKEAGASDAIFRQDIPYTRTALVLAPDDPEADPTDVTLADAMAWSKTGDELFALAIENLERRYPPVVRETPPLRRDVRVQLYFGQHRYGAGYALSLEARHEDCLGRKGSLVVIANQHAMLCYPVESSRAFHAYLALVNMAADITVTGDDPLVPHVFWYHEGVWDAQLVTVEGNRFEYERTPDFVELLKELPRDIHDPRERRY
ncbi:MAG TPA: hypothetical protein VKB65_08670 [Myxococcota bacterium]|nr:hypothetical protein [Myxococcota bacterium]